MPFLDGCHGRGETLYFQIIDLSHCANILEQNKVTCCYYSYYLCVMVASMLFVRTERLAVSGVH